MNEMKKVTVRWLIENRNLWRTSDTDKEWARDAHLPAAYIMTNHRAIVTDDSGSLTQIHQINERDGQYTLWNMLSFGNDWHDLAYPCTLETEVYLEKPANGYYAKNWADFPNQGGNK